MLYEGMTRFDLESYDHHMLSKELSKKGDLRPLVSSFLELYFKNPLEVTDFLERGSFSPDPYAQEKLEESRAKLLNDIAIRQSFIDMKTQELDLENNKLLDFIEAEEFSEYKNKMLGIETEEEVKDSGFVPSEVDVFSKQLEEMRTTLNSIYYKVQEDNNSNFEVTETLDSINFQLTQLVPDVLKARLDTMEQNILSAISSNPLQVKEVKTEKPKEETVIKEVKEVYAQEPKEVIEKSKEENVETNKKTQSNIANAGNMLGGLLGQSKTTSKSRDPEPVQKEVKPVHVEEQTNTDVSKESEHLDAKSEQTKENRKKAMNAALNLLNL